MLNGLDHLFEGDTQPGSVEIRQLLGDLFGGSGTDLQFIEERQLQSHRPRVFRIKFSGAGKNYSLILKKLEPAIAQVNELVVRRWLPSVGLSASGPLLRGVAASKDGQSVWHIYEDFGDWAIDVTDPDPECLKAAIHAIAGVHSQFQNHPLLPECRLHGTDFGVHFLGSNVRDAIRCLDAVTSRPHTGPVEEPPALTPEHDGLCGRLLIRLQHLLDEVPARAEALAEFGGPETLLHGDLWATNTLVIPARGGLEARLIDWDHAGVGYITYDLSTFLLRFQREQRQSLVELYQEAVEHSGIPVPDNDVLNHLCETAELARFANRIIWPALAIFQDRAEWGFDELAEIERWFENLEPVLTTGEESCFTHPAGHAHALAGQAGINEMPTIH